MTGPAIGHRAIRYARSGSRAILDVGLVFGAVFWADRIAQSQAESVSVLVWTAAVGGVVVVGTNWLSSSYRSVWRFFGFPDAVALAASAAGFFAVVQVGDRLGMLPVGPSVAWVAPFYYLLAAAGMRMLRRWQATESKVRAHGGVGTGSRDPVRVLIAGAGRCGLSLSRDLVLTAPAGVRLVGFLDDDVTKSGAMLSGAPVLGCLDDVMAVAEALSVNQLVVAIPSASRDVLRRLIRRAEDIGIRVRAVPGVERLVRGTDLHRPGNVTMHDLVDVVGINVSRPPEKGGVVEKSRTVLVTGGAGFIGSHVTRMLLERGYRVRILEDFSYGRSGIAAVETHPKLEIVHGDICNIRHVTAAVRDADAVIALAALVGDPACNLNPQETINLNYEGTKILIEACNFFGVRRLVFASSCSVYGASGSQLLTERSRLNPVSLYARTRILSENILFDRHGDVEPVILRLSTVFGLSPRMRFDLVVNTFTARAVLNGEISVFGGNQWRPNVHCRDAARAFIMAMEADSSVVSGEIFNVGGEALNVQIGDLADMVVAAVPGTVKHVESDIPDPRDYRVGFEKIRSRLGFEPRVTLSAGIGEVAAAIQAESDLQRFDNVRFHNVRALRERWDGDAGKREPATVEVGGAT